MHVCGRHWHCCGIQFAVRHSLCCGHGPALRRRGWSAEFATRFPCLAGRPQLHLYNPHAQRAIKSSQLGSRRQRKRVFANLRAFAVSRLRLAPGAVGTATAIHSGCWQPHVARGQCRWCRHCSLLQWPCERCLHSCDFHSVSHGAGRAQNPRRAPGRLHS